MEGAICVFFFLNLVALPCCCTRAVCPFLVSEWKDTAQREARREGESTALLSTRPQCFAPEGKSGE